MAESNGVSDPPASAAAAPGSEDVSAGKGKGKAVESSIGTSAPAQDIEMDDEDDEDEDEVVRLLSTSSHSQPVTLLTVISLQEAPEGTFSHSIIHRSLS